MAHLVYKYDAYGTVCVASVRAMEEESGEQGKYYKELLRCVNSVYSNVECIMGDITNSYIQHVSNESTGVIEEMYRKHSRVFCPCRVTVYVSKGPHCWIDGKEYPSHEQYLSDVGQSSYYIRVQDAAVAEVLELSPQFYPWSRHPINPNRNCACNLKITKLTVSYVVNDLRLDVLYCDAISTLFEVGNSSLEILTMVDVKLTILMIGLLHSIIF